MFLTKKNSTFRVNLLRASDIIFHGISQLPMNSVGDDLLPNWQGIIIWTTTELRVKNKPQWNVTECAKYHGRNLVINFVWLIEASTLSQYKDRLSRYGDFQYKHKMIIRPSYLYVNPYAGKSACLFWTGRWYIFTWGKLVIIDINLMPSHYLKQCWLYLNCTTRNKLQWNWNL